MTILMNDAAPRTELLLKLSFSSSIMFLLGLVVFRNLKKRFYNYL